MFLQTEDRRRYKELREELERIEQSYVESITAEKTLAARRCIEEMNNLYGRRTKSAIGSEVGRLANSVGLQAVCRLNRAGGRTTWDLFSVASGRRIGGLSMDTPTALVAVKAFAAGLEEALPRKTAAVHRENSSFGHFEKL